MELNLRLSLLISFVCCLNIKQIIIWKWLVQWQKTQMLKIIFSLSHVLFSFPFFLLLFILPLFSSPFSSLSPLLIIIISYFFQINLFCLQLHVVHLSASGSYFSRFKASRQEYISVEIPPTSSRFHTGYALLVSSQSISVSKKFGVYWLIWAGSSTAGVEMDEKKIEFWEIWVLLQEKKRIVSCPIKTQWTSSTFFPLYSVKETKYIIHMYIAK